MKETVGATIGILVDGKDDYGGDRWGNDVIKERLVSETRSLPSTETLVHSADAVLVGILAMDNATTRDCPCSNDIDPLASRLLRKVPRRGWLRLAEAIARMNPPIFPSPSRIFFSLFSIQHNRSAIDRTSLRSDREAIELLIKLIIIDH
jgi:hypothetical protein